MSLKSEIEKDLKAAMLAGDKELVSTLRGLKSAILYAEVAEGLREEGLGDEKLIALLHKEAKKRQDSADLYGQGGNTDKQKAELAEKEIIEKYLPEQIPEEELIKIVEDSISEIGNEKQNMGKIIGLVKQRTAGNADGAYIARLVKERL